MVPRRGELIKVSSLFDKYLKTLKAPQKTVEKAACSAIKAVTGIELLPEQVEYTVSTKILYIKAPAIIRQEVKIHSEDINTQLQLLLAESQKKIQLL